MPMSNQEVTVTYTQRKETATYYTIVWPRPDTRLTSLTPPQPVSAPQPPPTCHPLSYWLLLFSSQTFSCINTPTVLSSSHTSYHLPMKMEQIRVFRNVGIYNSDAGELPKRKHNIFKNLVSRNGNENKEALASWRQETPVCLLRSEFPAALNSVWPLWSAIKVKGKGKRKGKVKVYAGIKNSFAVFNFYVWRLATIFWVYVN